VIIPREAMWDAIQSRRGKVVTAVAPELDATPVTVLHTRRSALAQLPRWVATASAAAVLAIAITVARKAPAPAPTNVAAAADSTTSAAVWQEASSQHFGLAESMLTMLTSSPEAQSDAQLTAWSRDLLESTRLLMDSPAGRDPKRRLLLQELELVLVQLVESGPAMRTEDRTMLDQLMTRSALLLTRIRTTIPAGMPASHN
jgi:hypothetical protein